MQKPLDILPKMCNIFLTTLTTLTLLFIAANVKAAPLGNCFENVDAFLKDALGNEALQDENVVRTSKGSWTWVVDQTASKNYTWYGLERAGNEFCFRAFIQAASSVEYEAANGSPMLKATIGAEADFPGKLIVFKRNPVSMTFLPVSCFLLRPDNRKQIARQSVPCESIFD